VSTLTAIKGEGGLQVSARTRLRYHTWEVKQPRAAVVVVHGLAEHGGRYDRLGRTLAAADISTFALDLRGHGESDGRRGHASSFACFLQDLDRFQREVQGLLEPETPMFLLGHSMGGLIALRYQQEYPGRFRGLVAVSPWLATAVSVPRWKVNLANGLARFLPALPFRAHIRPEQLSHDPAVLHAHRNDPLIHDTITPRLFTAVSTAMGTVLQRIDRLTVPLLFLLAGADPLVDTEHSVDFARSLSAHDVTLHVYPGLYHEVLNEQRATAVYRDLRVWLERHQD
jgi:lysophospholipase